MSITGKDGRMPALAKALSGAQGERTIQVRLPEGLRQGLGRPGAVTAFHRSAVTFLWLAHASPALSPAWPSAALPMLPPVAGVWQG